MTKKELEELKRLLYGYYNSYFGDRFANSLSVQELVDSIESTISTIKESEDKDDNTKL